MKDVHDKAVFEELAAAAADLGCRGLRSNAGDPLPNGLSVRAHEAINADPAGFRRLVSVCREARTAWRAGRFTEEEPVSFDDMYGPGALEHMDAGPCGDSSCVVCRVGA